MANFLIEYRPFLAETTRPVYTTIAAVPEEFFWTCSTGHTSSHAVFCYQST